MTITLLVLLLTSCTTNQTLRHYPVGTEVITIDGELIEVVPP